MRAFLSHETIAEIARDSAIHHGLASIAPLRAFLSADALSQILNASLEQH